MSRCRICNADNPPTAQRCESCGAWLDAPASGQEAAELDATDRSPPGEPANPLPAPSDPLEAAVVDLMRRSRKIEAIKRYREATGKGLKDSKDAVEEIAQRFGVPSHSGGAGCGAAAVAAVVFGSMIWIAISKL